MPLSPNQKRALKNAYPSARKAMLSNFLSQKKVARPKAAPQKKPAPKQQARPARTSVPRTSVPRSVRMSDHPLNAFNSKHLPTAHREAPYLSTTLFEMLDVKSASYGQLVVVAQRSIYDPEYQTGPISDFIAFTYNVNDLVSAVDSALLTPITPSKYVRHSLMNRPAPVSTGSKYFSLRHRLHKLSAKIECLGTDAAGFPPGETWIGRVPSMETGSTSNAFQISANYMDAYVTKALTVGMLRGVPNKALQGRPITVHAIMNEDVAYHTWHDLYVGSLSTNLNHMDIFPGLTPILVYVPPATGSAVVNIRIHIAMQFCSRHPDDVIARAAQKQYEPSSSSVWNAAVSSVEDAADAVAAYDIARIAAAAA